MENFFLKNFWFLGIIIATGCADSRFSFVPPNGLEKTEKNHLAVTTTDFTVGALQNLELTKSESKAKKYPIHSDAIVRASKDQEWLYVVNRFGADSILVVSRDFSVRAADYSVGKESNPQDIAILNETKAFVSQFGKPEILVIHPQTGKPVENSIDLKKFADSDGNPEMTWLKIQGKSLLVQLQRLKDYVPSEYSSVLTIGIDDQTIKETRLLRTNPVTDFKEGPDGSLYLGEAGWQGAVSKLDGGIEKFSPDSFQSQGIVVTEETLGGDIMDFEILSEELGVAVVSTPRSKLVAFNPKTGHLIRSQEALLLPEGEPYTFPFLVQDRARKLFYLTDRDKQNPGIRVFRSETLKEMPGQRWNTELPPYHLVLF